MNYLLDTNAVSDLIRENAPLLERIGDLASEDEPLTCTIVCGELLHGIARLPQGKKRVDLQEKASRVLASFDCVPVPPPAAAEYARIKLERERAGLPLNENDLWIAATATFYRAVLVTRDQAFKSIAGLSVEDWTT